MPINLEFGSVNLKFLFSKIGIGKETKAKFFF